MKKKILLKEQILEIVYNDKSGKAVLTNQISSLTKNDLALVNSCCNDLIKEGFLLQVGPTSRNNIKGYKVKITDSGIKAMLYDGGYLETTKLQSKNANFKALWNYLKDKTPDWLQAFFAALTFLGITITFAVKSGETKKETAIEDNKRKVSLIINNSNVQKDTSYKRNEREHKTKILYFNLANHKNTELIKKIENDKYKFSPNADNIIEITHSGTIENCPQCIYSGGYIIIKYNNVECALLKNFTISRLQDVNPHDVIDKYISDSIEYYIDNNQNEFRSKILKACLTQK